MLILSSVEMETTQMTQGASNHIFLNFYIFFKVTYKCCANSPRICPIGRSQTPQICPDLGWDLYRDMAGAWYSSSAGHIPAHVKPMSEHNFLCFWSKFLPAASFWMGIS